MTYAEVVADGQDLVLGVDADGRVGEFGGAPGGGADVVEMEFEQPRLAVRGGQPGDQRVERVLAGRGLDEVPVGDRVRGRFGFGGRDQRDQDVLGVDDQVADQVPHEPAGAAGRPFPVLVGEFVDRRSQRRPRA
jgi:hypothetical protein